MKSLAILQIFIQISVCLAQQTDDEFLQNVLSTGPLSTGSGDEEREPSLESYLQEQYFDLKQQISVGMSPASSQKFDLMQIVVSEGISTGRPKLLKFELPNPAPADLSNIKSANLRFFLNPQNRSFILEAIEVIQVIEGKPKTSLGDHRLISVQFIGSYAGQEGQWLSFNVLPSVLDWMKGDKPNLGLLVEGLHLYGMDSFLHQPILIIKYNNPNSDSQNMHGFEILRTQNDISVQTDELITSAQGNTSCKRNAMKVNFRNWGLIEPKDQDIGFCSGTCHRSELGFGAAEHTALLALLSERDPNLTGPQCSAKEFESVAIMYKQANGHYIIKRVPRLAVKTCGCH